MTLDPFLAAGPAIQLHTLSATAALLASAAVFLWTKGTARHVLAGRIAALGLLATALSSFWVTHDVRFSWIHALSVLTLITLGFGLHGIRKGNRRAHAANMIGAVTGLAVAGLFTLLPGRVLHAVFFGG